MRKAEEMERKIVVVQDFPVVFLGIVQGGGSKSRFLIDVICERPYSARLYDAYKYIQPHNDVNISVTAIN